MSIGALTLLAVAVAASLLAGALVAARVRLPPRVAAAITAFGGGILVASVALELVPDATRVPVFSSRPPASRWELSSTSPPTRY